MVSVDISSDFGWVILVFIASIIVLMWLGVKVGMARKKYEVPYPNMYSTNSTIFNCIQRAHQNCLESYPYFLVLMIFAGFAYPRFAALCGLVWVASRVVYAQGYYTGDPAKRNRGAFGYLGLLSLFFTNIYIGVSMLGLF